MSAKDLSRLRQKKIALPHVPGLSLAHDGLVVLAGPPGAGKTTMGLLMLGDLRPAVMFSFEEGFSETLADKLRRLELRYDDLLIECPTSVTEAYALLDAVRPQALLVDSLRASTFTISDLRGIATGYRVLVIAIQHVTKGGEVGGESAISYDADVVIRVESGTWTLTKSRFQALTSGSLLEIA